MKHWLEAISIGVQQTSFKYDNEGYLFKFDFEQIYWGKEIFTISEAEKDEEIFIKAEVDRRQLVKSFYLGLLNFASSDKFVSEEWEVEYMKDRLCKILNMDEETLIQSLLDLNKKELGELLFNANPTYYRSYNIKTDKNEEIEIFLQVDEEEALSDIKNEIKPKEWNIPDDYDYWPTDKKTNFIIECIHKETSGYEGMKIVDFRSKIIEEYIDKNEK